MSAPGETLFIEGNGPRIAYEVHGADPGAPTLILAHGNSSHRGLWRPMVGRLLGVLDVRVVLVDMRGHGESEHVRPPAYDPSDHASDLERVVRHLSSARYAVIGHSAGALAVTAFAARCARETMTVPPPAALVWIDIDPCVPAWQVEFFNTRADTVGRLYPDADSAVRALVKGIQKTNAGIREDVLSNFVAEGLKQTPAGFMLKLDPQTYATWSPGDLRPLLPLVNIPALVLRGGSSIVSSDQGVAELRAGLPRVTCAVVEAGSHYFPLDHPVETAELLVDFLRGELLG